MILPCADMLLLVPQNQSPLDGKSDEQIEEQARADLAQRAERQKRARPESDVPINDEIEYVHRHSPLFAAYCASCHPPCPLTKYCTAVQCAKWPHAGLMLVHMPLCWRGAAGAADMRALVTPAGW